MKSEEEVKYLLEKVNNLTKRMEVLKNPPEEYKIGNFNYQVLLCQQDLLKYLLGEKGYDFEEYYDHFSKNLDSLENNS